MAECTDLLIYRSPQTEFHKEEILDTSGRKHSFYLIITKHEAYTLSESVGIAFEKRIRKVYESLGCEGVDYEMFSLIFFCESEKMH